MTVTVPPRQAAQRIDQLHTDGFTSVAELISADEVAGLRSIYDDVLERRVDCGDDDRMLGGLTRQVMVPRSHHPDLPSHPICAAAQAMAASLLGCDNPRFLFDMMIFKPPGHPEETPWHQDLAYQGRPFAAAGVEPANATIQVWVAVDNADEENGCMHFVPGVHAKPMLEHHVFSGDPSYEGRLLAIVDPEHSLDLSAAVACPLASGGATFHYEGTPHYTPPNRSADRPRRAYITNFYNPEVVTFGS